MPFNNTQRLFALLAAVLVVCSFIAAPVAAAGGTSEWGDSLDGTSSSDDSGSTDSDDTSSDDGETDDSKETPDSEDDTESDSGDSDTTDGDSSDDNEEADSTAEEATDTVDDTTDTLEDGTESTTETVDDTVDETTETVDDTTDTVQSTTEEPIQTLVLDATFTNPGGIDGADTTLLMSTDSTIQADTEVTSTDTTRASVHDTAAADATEADENAVLSAGATTGGQPLPSAPLGVGGAAISLGLLAGVAVLRSTPLLAGGLPSLGLGTGISMPAILSKLRPFFFPLRYSRYDDSDPLEHEAREEVYEIVNDSPGSYLSEVSEEADLPLSTTRHHIKVLEREDLVSGAKLRGKRRFYPAYAEGVELAAALNDEATASIIDAIARIGSASVSDLADDIGRDPSTISHHLQRLEEDGIITREREGRAVMNKLSGEARTALEPDSTPKPGDAGSAIAGGAD